MVPGADYPANRRDKALWLTSNVTTGISKEVSPVMTLDLHSKRNLSPSL
jgi:hypothetical protein